MGGAPSKLPPIRQRDALPSSAAISGFSPGDAQGCAKCELVVAQGLSASGAKIYREPGTISMKECDLFKTDTQRVSNKEMAFDEFKANLIAGKYFREQDNGFCAQLKFTNEDLQNIKDPNAIPWDKTRIPSIRKVTSGGGYSSMTKLFIKPAIPFNLSFNGEQIQVNTMTLFHPCPIRIENVQYDAVLTLGDVADSTVQTIIMVPVAGSLTPGKSGTFFSKIASFIPGILLPDPASGQYKQIDVPTGKDWNISSLFPASPRGIANLVDEPYYVWNEMPPMELYLKQTIQNPNPLPNIEQYGWRPNTNAPMRKFIMLAKPVPMNTFDLQTIRMLPATPTEDAIPPPLTKSLVFKPCPPPSTREKFTTEKDESCDPFAYMNQTAASKIDMDAIIAVLIGAITIVAVCIGIYFAMKYAGQPVGIKLKDWGEQFGSALSRFGRQASKVDVTKLVPVAPTTPFQLENPIYNKPTPKKPGIPKSEPTLDVDEQQAEKEAKLEREREEAAKKLYETEQAKKKELEEKMKDDTLPESEQKRIRKDYQKITGEYRPTKKEQEDASGTGLTRGDSARRVFEEEREKRKEAEEKAKAEEQAKKEAEEKAKTEEQAKKEAEEKAKTEEQAKKEAEEDAKKIFEEQRAKEKRLASTKPPEVPVDKAKPFGTKNLGLRPRSASPPSSREPARPPFSPFVGPIKARKGEVPVSKKQVQEAKQVFEEEKKKEEPKPKTKAPTLPPHLRSRTLGNTNLGIRERSASPPTREIAKPPAPPNMKPIVAKIKQEQKEEINKVLQKIENAKTESQEEKMKRELASLKEKQKTDLEKRIEDAKLKYLRSYYGLPTNATERDLEEAQSKLRESVKMYRRGQQGRNILTGRGRTMRN